MIQRLLLAVAAATLAAPALAADYVHTDGSAAYVVPAGITLKPDSRLKANQASFDVDRRGVARAGVCVLSINLLPADANLDSWAKMKQTAQADPEAMARKTVRAPDSFVGLGGFRPLTLRGGGDGYVYWVTSRQPDGREQTDLTAIGLIDQRHLYAANCSSEPGLTFAPAEIERIFRLAASVKQP
ncbi:MAG: hypothetical protein Q7T61_10260 [Caulobacter sp.]|nr:hypothetical protein [Caulobacter sp.]